METRRLGTQGLGPPDQRAADEYSLWTRDVERKILPAVRELVDV
jgi:hypothetical protein